ncbi:MAG: VanW family protein [Clostridia bacterium]|nr:VanW family protein [Clostridia bacterium]
MPFYNLQPCKLTLRAKFFTSYTTSIEERKCNIKLATKSINGTILDVGEEFSFNKVVGARTEKRGYKTAKIIVGGKFTDGVGGGVCQVSTTLYNAVLLSGLKVTEYHPHTLPVSYVAPSFDAMVNSYTADLKFVNTTQNPIIIMATADGSNLTFFIYGEPMQSKFIRESVVVERTPKPLPEIIVDEKQEYKELFKGEEKIIQYGKEGIKSQGKLIEIVNGKKVSVKTIRKDTYLGMQDIIVIGTKEKVEEENFIIESA